MKTARRERVVFGVDENLPSWVAASILRNQDFDLLAIHLYVDLQSLGLDPALFPSALHKSDLERIERFCKSLEVPLKTVDVTEEVLGRVEDPAWIAGLAGKRFPAASTWTCDILIPHLLAAAKSRGAPLIATGHFASRTPYLIRYSDPDFDQSSRLAALPPAILEKLRLPLGDVSLEMLLRLAVEVSPPGTLTIPANQSPESVSRFFREARAKRGRWERTAAQLADPRILERSSGIYFTPGTLLGSDVTIAGEHRGVPYYSVGEPYPDEEKKYVQTIDAAIRRITVSSLEGLAVPAVSVRALSWCGERSSPAHRCQKILVEVDGRTENHPGPRNVAGSLLEYPDHLASIQFDTPLYGITPGDRLAFFDGSRVLGSAIIAALTDRVAPQVQEAN